MRTIDYPPNTRLLLICVSCLANGPKENGAPKQSNSNMSSKHTPSHLPFPSPSTGHGMQNPVCTERVGGPGAEPGAWVSQGLLATTAGGSAFRKVSVRGSKEFPDRIIMFCISGIHVAYSPSEEPICKGDKQCITTHALFTIWVC